MTAAGRGPASARLVGRGPILEVVADYLAAGRSILLTGPTGIGKSALIQALATPGVTTIDPFERVTPARASRLRRLLDRGAVCLAAASARDSRLIGAVGRILWRFTTVRIPPLPPAAIQTIIAERLQSDGWDLRHLDRQWVRKALAEARGRPGYALAIATRAARDLRGGVSPADPGLVVLDLRISVALPLHHMA
jgi:energy-coupling factor transporter ATP-binding protein EcfA2